MTCAALAFSSVGVPVPVLGQQNVTPRMEVLPLRGAIGLYDKACVRCHGPSGSFYGSELGKGKTPEQLRKMVWEMCIAQGGLTVSQREIDAMTAYHRSIMHSEPYVEVLGTSPTKVIGEATPGSSLQLQIGTKVIPVTLNENRWHADIETTKDATLIAMRNGKTTRLPVALGRFSLHQQ